MPDADGYAFACRRAATRCLRRLLLMLLFAYFSLLYDGEHYRYQYRRT